MRFLFLFFVLFSAPAMACISSPEEFQKRFEGVDTNGDGQIDLEEFEFFGPQEMTEEAEEELAKEFARYDEDKDNILSLQEFPTSIWFVDKEGEIMRAKCSG